MTDPDLVFQQVRPAGRELADRLNHAVRNADLAGDFDSDPDVHLVDS